MAIGDTYTIGGITGTLMKYDGQNEAILFDGKKNHSVSVDELKSKRELVTKSCSGCKKELTIDKFRRFGNGSYSAMCSNCRTKKQLGNMKNKQKLEQKKMDRKVAEKLVEYVEVRKEVEAKAEDELGVGVRRVVEVAAPNPTPPTKPESDKIIPSHYHNSKVDRIEVWYQTNDMKSFRAIMRSHIDKYVWRYEHKGGVEDLDKANEFIRRLKEYENL